MAVACLHMCAETKLESLSAAQVCECREEAQGVGSRGEGAAEGQAAGKRGAGKGEGRTQSCTRCGMLLSTALEQHFPILSFVSLVVSAYPSKALPVDQVMPVPAVFHQVLILDRWISMT